MTGMTNTSDWQAAFEPATVDEPEETAVTEPAAEDKDRPATTTRPRRRATSSGPEHIVRLALAVAGLSKARRELLASLSGQRNYDDSEPARVRLVLAALQGASLAGVISRALELAGAEPLEAGVLAAELASDRQALAAAWAAVGAEGAPQVQRPGIALARAAGAVSPGRRHDLEALKEVLS